MSADALFKLYPMFCMQFYLFQALRQTNQGEWSLLPLLLGTSYSSKEKNSMEVDPGLNWSLQLLTFFPKP